MKTILTTIAVLAFAATPARGQGADTTAVNKATAMPLDSAMAAHESPPATGGGARLASGG